MRTRIGTQLILGAGLVTALAIGALAVLVAARPRSGAGRPARRAAPTSSARRSRAATHYDMLENRRDSLQRQIAHHRAAGRASRRVRVFNKEGRVVFSSDARRARPARSTRAPRPATPATPRTARSSGPRSRARSRIFAAHRRPPRARHHQPDPQRAGLLGGSLPRPRRRATGAGRARRDALAGGRRREHRRGAPAHGRRWRPRRSSRAASILWWLNRRLVLRPVEALAEGTRRVAAGDLATPIPVAARHELGDLARAFNEMTRRLAEAQRQLTQADKLASVGRLAAGVAHEINNPLTGVLTYASFLLKRAPEDERAARRTSRSSCARPSAAARSCAGCSTSRARRRRAASSWT